MRRLGMFLGISAGFAGPAISASWAMFAECGDSDHLHTYTYDVRTLKSRSGQVLVRVNVDYSRDPMSRATLGAMQWSVDCAAKTFFEKSRVDYSANHRVVADYRKPSQKMTITPGSVADKLSRKVCA